MARLKCPRCNNRYTPSPEDFTHPQLNSDENYQIFLRRYGKNAEGKNIECLICLDPICDSINYVEISTLKAIPAIIGLPISPYKPYKTPSVLLDVKNEVNRVHDLTSKNITSILSEDLNIPVHIYELLLGLDILTVGEYGLKFRGKYCHGIHRSIGAFVSSEYSMEELKEQYDIQDRLSEIQLNKNSSKK